MTCEGAVLSDRSWSQDTFPKVEPKHYVWLLLRLPNKLSPCCGRISCPAFCIEDTQPWPLTNLKEISCRPLAAAVHSYPSCTATRINKKQSISQMVGCCRPKLKHPDAFPMSMTPPGFVAAGRGSYFYCTLLYAWRELCLEILHSRTQLIAIIMQLCSINYQHIDFMGGEECTYFLTPDYNSSLLIWLHHNPSNAPGSCAGPCEPAVARAC